MRKAVLFFLSCFSLLVADGHASNIFTDSHSGEKPNPAETVLSAFHGVVTRTIVIDYSPFPDLARSVDNAIIKEGEMVNLESDLSKDPCQATEHLTPDGKSSGGKMPAVRIVSEKSVLCEGQTGTLTALGASSYTWNTGEQSEVIRISPVLNSTFFVIGENKQGCKSVAYYLQRVEGCVDEATADAAMQIFPNPSAGRFFLKVQAQGRELVLFVYNDMGRLVEEKKIETEELEIDLSGHPDGMYLLRLLEYGKEVQRKRLFKKN